MSCWNNTFKNIAINIFIHCYIFSSNKVSLDILIALLDGPGRAHVHLFATNLLRITVLLLTTSQLSSTSIDMDINPSTTLTSTRKIPYNIIVTHTSNVVSWNLPSKCCHFTVHIVCQILHGTPRAESWYRDSTFTNSHDHFEHTDTICDIKNTGRFINAWIPFICVKSNFSACVNRHLLWIFCGRPKNKKLHPRHIPKL